MTFSSLPSILDLALRTQSWQVPSTGCGTEVLPKFLLESGEAEALSNSSIMAYPRAMLTAVAPEVSEMSGFLCLQSKTPCRDIRPYSALGPLWSPALSNWGLLPRMGGSQAGRGPTVHSLRTGTEGRGRPGQVLFQVLHTCGGHALSITVPTWLAMGVSVQ